MRDRTKAQKTKAPNKEQKPQRMRGRWRPSRPTDRPTDRQAGRQTGKRAGGRAGGQASEQTSKAVAAQQPESTNNERGFARQTK